MRISSRADLETARFGLNVARGTLRAVDGVALAKELIRDRVDVAILRIPARPDSGIAALHAVGFSPIHADTLVTYSCDLGRYTPQALFNPSLDIRPATHADDREITALVRTVFAEYPNHYCANPLLPRDDIVAGYCEWALSHIDAADRTCWVACVEGRVAGLACSAFDTRTGLCQGVLHGVLPEFARNRIYTDLIRFTQHFFRDRGLAQLEISTQVGNLRVQRVWVREGLTFESAVDTLHINALFGAIAASQPPMTWRAPERGPADAGWLCARFLEAIDDDAQARGSSVVGCRASLLADLQGGAAYQAGLGWTPPRPGLPAPYVVCAVNDGRGDPVAWLSASCAPARPGSVS
jgi:hypothetical protein